MHELSIISALVKTVEQIMQQEGLTQVDTIVLQVGELSGVVPHFVEECYPAAVYQTSLEQTKLKMEVIPGIVRCQDCGEEFSGYQYNLKCPKCGSERLDALSGREFILKEIVAC